MDFSKYPNLSLDMLQCATRNEPDQLAAAIRSQSGTWRQDIQGYAVALHAAIAATATECIRVLIDLLPDDIAHDVLTYRYNGVDGEFAVRIFIAFT